MKIFRTINGCQIEIELTREEMCRAREALRSIEVVETVAELIEALDDDDDYAALKVLTGEAKNVAVEDISCDMELLMGNYGYDADEAFRQAAGDYLFKE